MSQRISSPGGLFSRAEDKVKLSDDEIEDNVISTRDSRLLYLSIMRFGAAKVTEMARTELRWLFHWRHQTLQSDRAPFAINR